MDLVFFIQPIASLRAPLVAQTVKNLPCGRSECGLDLIDFICEMS